MKAHREPARGRLDGLSGRRRPRSTLVLLALVIVGILVMAWRWMSPGSAGTAVANPAATLGLAKPAPVLAPGAGRIPGGPAKLIDEIVFDRVEACENEPFTARVIPRDTGEGARDLFVSSTADVDGNPMVLGFPHAGEYPIMFIVHDGRGRVEQRIQTLKVNDCGGSFAFVELSVRRQPVPDVVAFFARPHFGERQAAPAGSPHPSDGAGAGTAPRKQPDEEDVSGVVFSWDFGDGTTSTTPTGYVEHDFGGRSQDSRQSSFVVRVEARSQRGVTAVGVQTLSFVNVHYLNRDRGLVAPVVLPGPVRREGDDLVMPVTLRNPERDPIRVERLTAGLLRCAPRAGEMATGETATYHDLPPTFVLGTDVLSSGEMHLRVRFPAARVPADVCQVYFWGTGRSPGGIELDLQLSMMVVPPKAVPLDMSDPRQAELFEKVRRAAELLGRTGGRVTGEDIRRLEQEGRL